MTVIVWSDEFYADVERIVIYLIDNFGLAVADNFVKEIELKSSIIAAHPEIGRASKATPEIRKVSLYKNNWLYYKVTDTTIIFARVINQKMNPKSNPYE